MTTLSLVRLGGMEGIILQQWCQTEGELSQAEGEGNQTVGEGQGSQTKGKASQTEVEGSQTEGEGSQTKGERLVPCHLCDTTIPRLLHYSHYSLYLCCLIKYHWF